MLAWIGPKRLPEAEVLGQSEIEAMAVPWFVVMPEPQFQVMPEPQFEVAVERWTVTPGGTTGRQMPTTTLVLATCRSWIHHPCYP